MTWIEIGKVLGTAALMIAAFVVLVVVLHYIIEKVP